MRVLVYLLLIVVATVLSLGAGLLVALQFHEASHGLFTAAAFASPFLVTGPLVIGAFAGYWDHRSSRDAGRYLGWWFSGVVVVEVAAAVVIVLAALSAQAPVWVPVVLLLCAALLLVAARPLGALFRRTERPLPETPDDTVPDRATIHRKARVIAVTFVVSVVLATIGAALLAVFGGDRDGSVLQAVLLAGQLAFTATAMAAVAVSLSLSRALRDAGGRDIGRLRRFAKVVLRRKDIALDDEEQRGAVRYARLLPLSLQFQLVFIGLLYVGLAFQMVGQAIRGDLGVFPEVFLVFMVVVLVVLVPLTVRRIGRARAYVAEHAPQQA